MPRIAGLSFFLVAAAYLYVFPYQPRINNPNENVRFYMTVAIVDHGTFAIDAVEREWGWVNDKARYEGHVYSVKAPGTSLLGVPAYAAYRLACTLTGHARDRTEALWVCRLFASILPALLFLAWFRSHLKATGVGALGTRTAFFALALGSAFHAYALLFVSHTIAACCAFAAFGVLWDVDSGRDTWGVRQPLLAGLLAAAATAFEYPGLVATVVLCSYALVAIRPLARILWFGIGAAIPTSLVMLFQWRAFGSPFTPGHRYLDNPAYRALAREGFFGATGFDADSLGLLIDPAYGLFPLTPLLVALPIGVFALFRSRERRRPAAVALLIVVGTTLVITFMNNWRGGWTVGPRYLITVIPFAVWIAAVGWDAALRRAPRIATGFAVGLGAAGIVASGVPSALYPHVPEAFTRPIPQLFAVLVGHGYAPHSLGTMLGWTARTSLAPLAVIGVLAAVLPLGALPGFSHRVQAAGLAILVACAALVPIALGPPLSARGRSMLAHVTRTWRPAGRDDAAVLAARGRMDAAAWSRLESVYREEGRDSEADRAAREARISEGASRRR